MKCDERSSRPAARRSTSSATFAARGDAFRELVLALPRVVVKG